MNNKKKIIGNTLFLLLVFGLTLYGVFYGEDLSQIWAGIRKARPGWLLLGVICVVAFIWGESVIIHYLMKSLKIKVKKWTCFLFSSVGFFFSCITPSASGGQPMQIYYMKKEKIPIPVATLVLMIVTITYKLVLVVVGVGMLIFGQQFVHHYLVKILPVFYLGLGLNVACVGIMLILVFHPDLAKKMMIALLHLLGRMRLIRKQEQYRKKLEDSMELYHTAAKYLKENISVCVNVFLITVCQRFALFFATYFVYRAFGLKGIPFWIIVFLQASISVSVDMLPLPGGMGISENLFQKIFLPIFGIGMLLPGMILSRGLGYYVQLFLSAVMTGVAQLTIGRNHLKVR